MSVDVIAPNDEMVRHEVAALEANLVDEFCPPLDPAEVRRCCAEALTSLEPAAIQSYIVVLVEHDVRQTLRRALRDRTDAT